MIKGSLPFNLNELDWQKIGIGALVAIAGALLTYVSSLLTEINFGDWTPLVVVFWSVVSNIVRKWIADNS